MLRTFHFHGSMSKAKRRRKASISLAVIVVAPLVAAVSLQELGVIPLTSVTDECVSVLNGDIPDCTVSDFTTSCSADCRAKVSVLSGLLLHACVGALFEGLSGPLGSSSAQLELCSSPLTASPSGTEGLDTTFTTTYTTIFTSTTVDANSPMSMQTSTRILPLPQVLSGSKSGFPSNGSLSNLFSPISTPTSLLSAQATPISPALASLPSTSSIPLPFVLSVIPSQSLKSTASSSSSLAQNFLSTGSSAIVPPASSSTSTSTISADDASFILENPESSKNSPTTISIRPEPASFETRSRTTTFETTPTVLTQATDSDAPSSMMTFMLQPPTSNVPTPELQSSQSQGITSSPVVSLTSESSAAANNADRGGLPDAISTDQPSKNVNPSIIGGVVGGGLAAVGGITALIYFLLRRRKRNSGGGARRPISSWDFIDQRRGRPSSQPSDSSLPDMSYFDQPNFFDLRVPQLAVPQEVVIQRKSGPPVRVARQSGGSMTGFDEGTVEAVRMQRKTQKTARQYSNGSIIVSYAAARVPSPTMPTNNNMILNASANTNTNTNTNNNNENSNNNTMTMMMAGSPGPTVYNGPSQRRNDNPRTRSSNNISNYYYYNNSRQQRRNNPSPIDEMLEVGSGGGSSRLGFYDRVMDDPRLQNYRPGF